MENPEEQREADNENPSEPSDEEVDLYADLENTEIESSKKYLFSSSSKTLCELLLTPRKQDSKRKNSVSEPSDNTDDIDLYEDLNLFEKQHKTEEV